jgi:hypothetical protein
MDDILKMVNILNGINEPLTHNGEQLLINMGIKYDQITKYEEEAKKEIKLTLSKKIKNSIIKSNNLIYDTFNALNKASESKNLISYSNC